MVVVLVIVQGVLDNYGMQGGEPCMLRVGLYVLHSLNNCLMLLSLNMFYYSHLRKNTIC